MHKIQVSSVALLGWLCLVAALPWREAGHLSRVGFQYGFQESSNKVLSDAHVNLLSKRNRSADLHLGINLTNKAFQKCKTPKLEDGHCRPMQHCALPEFADNFPMFLKYFCVIQDRFVGVCCPDSEYEEQGRGIKPADAETECGRSVMPPKRIVNGTAADVHEWPWMAALFIGSDDSTHYCGGVLISNRHVLTAAHCVERTQFVQVSVRLGEYSFAQSNDSQHLDIPVKRIVIHELYNGRTNVNDISILTLSWPVNFTSEISPICLPESDANDFEGRMATATGWGALYFQGPASMTIQEVEVPVWSNADCEDAYKGFQIVNESLCAGYKSGGKDTCQGDSGGPLQLQESKTGSWTLIGIVSWGIRCADPRYPGVYTRVSKYLDWIMANTAS